MTASKVTDNSHSFYTLLLVPLVSGDKKGEERWSVQNYMLGPFVAN